MLSVARCLLDALPILNSLSKFAPSLPDIIVSGFPFFRDTRAALKFVKDPVADL